MRSDFLGAVRVLVLPTLALIALAAFAPGRLELGIRVYALILCATAIVLVLLALRRAYPDETPLRVPGSPAPVRLPPHSLGRLEHEVALSAAGSFDLHFRLVPRLRALAAGLLQTRRNIPLEASPEQARAILGEETWELVRPGRPAPQERLGRGMPASDLARVVDALEAI